MVLESLCNFFRLVISFTLSSSLVILSPVPWILLSQSFVLSILIIVFLVLKFLYSSSYIFFLFVKFIYLLKLFFSFVSSIFTFLQSRIFTITVLKSLLENSNLCHRGVGINQVYCFIPFEVFSLILGMMCDFFFFFFIATWTFGVFCYEVPNLMWSFCSNWLFVMPLHQGEWECALPCSSQPPHWPPLTTQRGMTSEWGWEFWFPVWCW